MLTGKLLRGSYYSLGKDESLGIKLLILPAPIYPGDATPTARVKTARIGKLRVLHVTHPGRTFSMVDSRHLWFYWLVEPYGGPKPELWCRRR